MSTDFESLPKPASLSVTLAETDSAA